jgi:hypothetical protein
VTGDSALAKKGNGQPALLVFALSVAIVTGVAGYDVFVLGLRPLREGAPIWSLGDVSRSLAYLVASACAVVALFRSAPTSPAAFPLVEDFVLDRSSRLMRIGVTAIGGVGIASVLLLVFAPMRFTDLAMEDNVVENASAIFALLAAISMLCLAWKLFRSRRHSALEVTAVSVFGLACFLIAGEEVSWLQRVFDWHPAFADLNQQKEANLHNFATGTSENTYYFFGGYVLFVLLPAARALRVPLGRLTPLVALFPSGYLIGVGALISALNYDMAMGVATQIAFWSSLLVLAGLAWRSSNAAVRTSALTWAALAVATQAVILSFGHQSRRAWDVTEYKELLIPSALFLWSLQLWNLRPATSTSQAEPSITSRSALSGHE